MSCLFIGQAVWCPICLLVKLSDDLSVYWSSSLISCLFIGQAVWCPVWLLVKLSDVLSVYWSSCLISLRLLVKLCDVLSAYWSSCLISLRLLVKLSDGLPVKTISWLDLFCAGFEGTWQSVCQSWVMVTVLVFYTDDIKKSYFFFIPFKSFFYLFPLICTLFRAN